MKFSTRDLCFCAIGAALIAVCAWISIPAEVPFTLQTFAIFTVCGLLGGKRGTVSVLVYLLLGAVGYQGVVSLEMKAAPLAEVERCIDYVAEVFGTA